MQEALNKTHMSMLSELHREYSMKERILRTHILSLGNVLPVLQMHLGLCTTFTSVASKYQFIEVADLLLERLNRVAQLGPLSQPPLLSTQLKNSYRSEFGRVLQRLISGQTIAPRDIFYDETHAEPQELHFVQVIFIYCKTFVNFQESNFFQSNTSGSHRN